MIYNYYITYIYNIFMTFIEIYKQYPKRLAFEFLVRSITMKDSRDSFIFYEELYIKHKVIIDAFLSAHYDNVIETKKNKFKNTMTAPSGSYKDIIYIFRNICIYYSIPVSSNRKYFNNTYKVYYFIKLN